jgi:hypothetical protein
LFTFGLHAHDVGCGGGGFDEDVVVGVGGGGCVAPPVVAQTLPCWKPAQLDTGTFIGSFSLRGMTGAPRLVFDGSAYTVYAHGDDGWRPLCGSLGFVFHRCWQSLASSLPHFTSHQV